MREAGGPLALDGHHLKGGHNNQKEVGFDIGGGGRWRGEAARAERMGGCCLPEPGIEWKKKKNRK